MNQSISSDPPRDTNVPIELLRKHTPSRGRKLSARSRARAVARAIERAYAQLSAAEASQTVPTGVEWLLDNHFIVRRAAVQVREGLTREFLTRLPPAIADRSMTRIEQRCQRTLEESDHLLNAVALATTIKEFAREHDASMAELWALPLLLRLQLLERLEQDTPWLASTAEDRSTNHRVANCVRSLLTLEKTDWTQFFEEVSHVHELLLHDASGHYPRMDKASRDRYRQVVEELARGSQLSESEVARRAVAMAQRDATTTEPNHVGEVLLGDTARRFELEIGYRPHGLARMRRWIRKHATTYYIGSIVGVAVLHMLALATALYVAHTPWIHVALLCMLAVVPTLTIGANLINWFTTLILPPLVLPKMDYRSGVPADQRTLVVVPALLSRSSDPRALLHSIESHFLASRDSHIEFALLTDHQDADAQTHPRDADLLDRLREGIVALNRKYGPVQAPPFHLFHRRRVWSESQQRWMGWERKRGKLSELNRLLRGDGNTTYALHEGSTAHLLTFRYVITLDADTIMPPGTARRLIETLSHPLNRAHFDEDTQRCVDGYTVLQPRVDLAPEASPTWFARVFAGDGSFDIYSRAASDVYQDLLGEGIFVGKGIYDIDAFERATQRGIPEDRVLSHDLLEGVLGRAGLVSDIVLYEDYPETYLAYARRLHRWIRGDWQLLPWLRSRVPGAGQAMLQSPLRAVSKWKIFDNLRRSVLAPSLVAFVLVAWMCLPEASSWWTTLVLIVLATPTLAEVAEGMLRGTITGRLRRTLAGVWASLPTSIARWILRSSTLVHEAFVAGDAIIRSIIRTSVTHRNQLEWTPAAYAGRGSHAARVIWFEMSPAFAFTLVVAVMLALWRPLALAGAVPLMLAWLAAPLLVIWTARTQDHPAAREQPTVVDIPRLRRLARRTWAYFEAMVGPEDHWLPPDHLQEHPHAKVAHRTSPTNIAMLLTGTVAAYDLGHLDLLEFVVRIQNTLDSISRMPRHRGHVLNWCDTISLTALEPRYVSTVDSGNLVAALMLIEETCAQMAREAVPFHRRFEGLADTASVLDESLHSLGVAADEGRRFAQQMVLDLHAAKSDPLGWPTVHARIIETCTALDRFILALYMAETREHTDDFAESQQWSVRIRSEIDAFQRELSTQLPWLAVLSRAPTSDHAPTTAALAAIRDALIPLSPTREIMVRHQAVRDLLSSLRESDVANTSIGSWTRELDHAVERGLETARQLRDRLDELAGTARRLAEETDFSFLYDGGRELFYIGYDASNDRFDEHHYDLLASEARLASLVAVGKNDVPAAHWAKLGRPLGRFGEHLGLLSWSGTMFEFLMPPLFIDEGIDTLLGATARAAVQAQIEYGRALRLPWGVSESAYARFDVQHNYQYRAFGVPTTGFRRGLDDDLVVAPYASLIALAYAPEAVERNLERIQQLGGCGAYGAFEAIDFTPSRVPSGRQHVVVRSYMSHHQGMVLAALDGFLADGAIVRRMRRHPWLRTVELLLRERAPARRARVELPQVAAPGSQLGTRRGSAGGWSARPDNGVDAWVVADGHYGVLITEAAAGHSVWRGLALTKPCVDPTLEDAGFAVFLRDDDDGTLWSFSHGSQTQSDRGVMFHPHGASFSVHEHGITAEMFVTVVADETELRVVRLTERSGRARRISIVGYAELVLDDARDHARHPAFSRLFVETQVRPEDGLILCHRRRRDPGQAPVWLAAALVSDSVAWQRYETDRGRFVGRGRTSRDPALHTRAVHADVELQANLDPCVALEGSVVIPAGGCVECTFVMSAADSRTAVIHNTRRLSSSAVVNSAVLDTQMRAHEEMLARGHDTAALQTAQRLLSAILYPRRALRAGSSVLQRNWLGQSSLWRHGLSGDLAFVLVRVATEAAASVVARLIDAHHLWCSRGVPIDLVILDEQEATYSGTLHARLSSVLERKHARVASPAGGVFLVSGAQLNGAERDVLFATARVVLNADNDDLDTLTTATHRAPPLPRFEPEGQAQLPTPSLPRPTTLVLDNGFGGFDLQRGEYVIHLEAGATTPAPWINVIANPRFGCVVSEAGSGYTFASNSGLNRLTRWSNDAVSDPPSESLYLRDELDGSIWSPTPSPAPAPGSHQVRHGIGRTTFLHDSHGLHQRVEIFVLPDDPVKIVRIRLQELWQRQRRITATMLIEWLLGSRESDAAFVVTDFEPEDQVVLARSAWNSAFSDRWSFVAASKSLHGLTTDREEFLGRRGDRRSPAALQRIGLSGDYAVSADPCAALQVHVDLRPGEVVELHFVLGQTSDREAALDLARRYKQPHAVVEAEARIASTWDELLSAVQVQTPDVEFDLMVNQWLLYQCVASRLWARSGFYQSSGAYGFRDQLQDVMALVYAAPEQVRAHILESARHQFVEGDVLHWWHPPQHQGLRSRCSDDLVWLPFVTAYYVTTTGDEGILRERVAFAVGAPLAPNEHERYDTITFGPEASLYEHCMRALDRANTSGSHGLPYIGAGDWNDGYSRVGIGGQGESVWLGWFLHDIDIRFAALCDRLGRGDDALRLREHAARLKHALEGAWDGAWYRRAYYDDGTPMGSHDNEECRIDSIAQSWAVLSGAATDERARVAMDSVWTQLVAEDAAIVRLFAPPFRRSAKDPGYVKAYPPGVRENGGQYTHAAVWAAWAFAKLGQTDRAHDVFRMLLPTRHTRTRLEVERYRVEPYAIVADIYSTPPHAGRGGWSWYTGSAAWAYRFAIEGILGITRVHGRLRLSPKIPTRWPQCSLLLREGPSRYRVSIENHGGNIEADGHRTIIAAWLDGVAFDIIQDPSGDTYVELPAADGREHALIVHLQ